jgi:hypothetical protein
LQIPNGLAELCAPYHGLFAVGLQSAIIYTARDRVRTWWVSFLTQEALAEFIAKVDESLYEEVKLPIEPTTPLNKYLAAKCANEAPEKPPGIARSYDGSDPMAAFE